MSDYSKPTAVEIIKAAPEAHWRKCWDCQTVNLHIEAITPWVLCPKCGSQDTRRMRNATALLRTAGEQKESGE
jgi:Zn finger protein HypA/HybF involved in hydrogenase expression